MIVSKKQQMHSVTESDSQQEEEEEERKATFLPYMRQEITSLLLRRCYRVE
jgi:hypothetical protein